MAKRKQRKEEDDEDDEVVVCNFCDDPIDPEENFINLSISVGNYNKRGEWMQEEVEPDIGAFHTECYRDVEMFKKVDKSKNGEIPDSAKDVMRWIEDILHKADELGSNRRKLEDEELEKPRIKKPRTMSLSEARKILGIMEGTSDDDVKAAFRTKMKGVHPDLHPDDPKANEKAARVREAYDALVE